MRLLGQGFQLPALVYAGVLLVAKKSTAELVLGTDDTLVSCSTIFSTPYNEHDGSIVHVQYLQDGNPYLCNTNFESLLSPWQDESSRSADSALLGLVALSGNCSLDEKVQMLESLSKDRPNAVRFLIVIDEDPATSVPDALWNSVNGADSSPCNSTGANLNSTTDDECGTSRPSSISVTVLSVNQKCGNHLLRYMANQENYTRSQGGPPVLLLDDDDRGPGTSNSDNVKSLLQLVALIVFSFAGSFLLAHIAFSFCRPSRQRRRRRRRRDAANQEGQARLCLLSEAHVERFQTEEATLQFFAQYYSSSKTSMNLEEGSSNCGDDEDWGSNSIHLPTCAVCLEVLALPCKVAVLPCGHPFHAECITPWLTQRQACCPLCKLVLLDPAVVEESAISAVDSQRTVDEEAGGDLGGASVGDENSILTSDLPASGHVAVAPVPFQRRRHWWNRWRLSPSTEPAVAEALPQTDLTLTAASEEHTMNDHASTSRFESSPSIPSIESPEPQ